jgi:hypothetical protein
MRFERWLNVLSARLRALFTAASLDRDLGENLRYHLDCLIERNIAKGLSPDEARRAAHLSMGGMERRKEECRDVRGTRLLADLWQDIRYAARMLRQAPAFTLIAVSSLGLGDRRPGGRFAFRGVKEQWTVIGVVCDSKLDGWPLAALSRFFGLAAAALTSVGLYGITSFAAGRRTHEFGVRLALGGLESRRGERGRDEQSGVGGGRCRCRCTSGCNRY